MLTRSPSADGLRHPPSKQNRHFPALSLTLRGGAARFVRGFAYINALGPCMAAKAASRLELPMSGIVYRHNFGLEEVFS